jgi:hypothetical protein
MKSAMAPLKTLREVTIRPVLGEDQWQHYANRLTDFIREHGREHAIDATLDADQKPGLLGRKFVIKVDSAKPQNAQ